MGRDTTEDLEVLQDDDKVVVELSNGDRYVYRAQGDGDYKWDHEDSDISHFPGERIENAVADRINGDIIDHFPITFTVHANSEKNTRVLCQQAGLPTDEDKLTDILYYYPGEFTVTYELTQAEGDDFDLEAKTIEYEGTRFTPE